DLQFVLRVAPAATGHAGARGPATVLQDVRAITLHGRKPLGQPFSLTAAGQAPPLGARNANYVALLELRAAGLAGSIGTQNCFGLEPGMSWCRLADATRASRTLTVGIMPVRTCPSSRLQRQRKALCASPLRAGPTAPESLTSGPPFA